MSEVRRRWERVQTWQRAWWAAFALVAVGGHLGLLWLAKPMPVVHQPQYPRPWIAFPEVGEGQAAAAWLEQAWLLDPAPLLLPTPWNGGVEVRADVHVPAVPVPFGPWASELAMQASALAPSVLPAVAGPGPGPAPPIGPRRVDEPWERWGEALRPPPAPPAAPAGRVIIRRSGDGRDVAALELPPGVHPGGDAGELWAPAEFLFYVAEGGRLGFPLLVTGTGVADVDGSLREFLTRASALSLLPPGYYRVILGP